MRKRKGIAVIAAIVMTAVMSLGSSLAATSVGMSDGAAAVKVEETIVGFAGHEWWVIGDADGGVYSKADSVTLLSKNYDFGDTAFNEYDNWVNTEYPFAYKDSTLQRKMESIANNFSVKEKGKINDRTITSKGESYPIWGADVENQKVWALSRDEYVAIGSDSVRTYGSDNWLRSYSPFLNNIAWFAPADGGSNIFDNFVDYNMAARPALNLNLESVIFTSDATAGSKSSATPGGGLVSVTAPDTTSTNNKIKYTFKDDSLKLGNVYVSKIEGNKVTVAYTGATAGKTLSVIAKEKSGSGQFYGKLSAKTAASGEGSFEVADNFDFTQYDFKIFVEEINGANASDFASTPKALDTTVKNMVAVSGGTGGGPHAPGTEVTIKAAPAAAGERFKRWEISPEVTPIQDTSFENETITFTMPDKDVTATVEYENVYTVTVNNGTISGGREYAEGEEVTLTANQPASGKYFKGWNISPEVTLKGGGTVNSSIIKFDMPAHAVTATAEYEDLVVYPIKDGVSSTWTQGDQGGLIITSEGEHRKFTDVSVDGAVVDRQHYTVESGSTIVTLKASYLSTLSVGEHVMRIHFTDGYTETRFSIQAAQTDKPNPPVQGGTTTATTVATVGTSPKTGDSNMIWIMVSVMLGAGIGFMVVSDVKQNKQEDR